MNENIKGLIPNFDEIKMSEKVLTVVISNAEIERMATAKATKFEIVNGPIQTKDFVLCSYQNNGMKENLQLAIGSSVAPNLQSQLVGKLLHDKFVTEVNDEMVEIEIEEIKRMVIAEFSDSMVEEYYGPALRTVKDYANKYLNDNKDDLALTIADRMVFPCLAQLDKMIQSNGELADIFLIDLKRNFLKQFGSEEAVFNFMKEGLQLKENQTIEDGYKLLYEECLKREHYIIYGYGLAKENDDFFNEEKYNQNLEEYSKANGLSLDKAKEEIDYDNYEYTYYEEYLFFKLKDYIKSKVVVKLEME